MLRFGGEDAAQAKSWFVTKLTTSRGRAHLNALADAGPAAEEFVQILQKIAIGPSHPHHDAALRAMRMIGASGEAVRAAYALARKDPSPYTRTLGALGLRSLR